MQDAFAALMFSELDFECQPWPSLSADAKDFVQHLLVKDPAKRATAIEALDHRYPQRFLRSVACFLLCIPLASLYLQALWLPFCARYMQSSATGLC